MNASQFSFNSAKSFDILALYKSDYYYYYYKLTIPSLNDPSLKLLKF